MKILKQETKSRGQPLQEPRAIRPQAQVPVPSSVLQTQGRIQGAQNLKPYQEQKPQNDNGQSVSNTLRQSVSRQQKSPLEAENIQNPKAGTVQNPNSRPVNGTVSKGEQNQKPQGQKVSNISPNGQRQERTQPQGPQQNQQLQSTEKQSNISAECVLGFDEWLKSMDIDQLIPEENITDESEDGLMIFNIEEFEKYIGSVLKEIPFLYTEQLIMYLVNTYQGVSRKLANKILLGLQRKGTLLLSADGLAMTKGLYHRVVDDRFDEKLLNKGCYRLPEMSEKIREARLIDYQKIREAIDCFWIVIDLLPNSENFFVARTPWCIKFGYVDNKGVGKLYEVAKFSANFEEIQREMIIDSELVPEKMRGSIVRIALMDNEKHNWVVPKIGFNYICVLDPKVSRKYRVIEKREGDDLWDDERKEWGT